MYFFFLPSRYWLYFGSLMKNSRTASIFFNLPLYQVNDGNKSWYILISSVALHFLDYDIFKSVFNSFIRQKLKSVLKFYNWPSWERKILQKLAASRERWSLQVCHCHFGHHRQQKLIIMNSVKNQWSWSLAILSKGSKWSRIWGMRVTLKLSPKIVLFKR